MTSRRVALGVAVAAVVALATTACGSGSGSGSLTKVSMGIAVKDDMSNSPLVLAKVEGIYKKYGLDVNLVYFQGGGAMVQALAAGKVDYGWVSHTPVIKAASQGAPVKIIAEVSKTAIGWGLMVKPDSPVKTPEDLKAGMKISYTSEGSLTNWLALYEASLAGLKPDQVQGVPIGTSLPTITTALQNGQVDAVTVLLPWGYELEKSGKARWVAKMSEQLPNFSYTGIDAFDNALKNTKTASCVVGAYTATIKWMKDHPDETQKWFQDFYSVSADIAKRAYDELMPDFSTDGILPADRLQQTIDTIAKIPGFLNGKPEASQVLQQIKPASESECSG
ncbi:MAG: ABC transporter substrate-binding protein [Acidothermus cellulolyticus]|nr:ABC transporter substrate-binding protein [Acidothermus cellulolyticus]